MVTGCSHKGCMGVEGGGQSPLRPVVEVGSESRRGETEGVSTMTPVIEKNAGNIGEESERKSVG